MSVNTTPGRGAWRRVANTLGSLGDALWTPRGEAPDRARPWTHYGR